MSIITMCVHGNAFCSEQFDWVITSTPDGSPVFVPTRDSGYPYGWGRTFAKSGWYHVPMSNITYFDADTMHLDEVLIHTTRSDNATFDRIDIWEGSVFLWGGAAVVDTSTDLLFRPRDESGQRIQANAGIGLSLHFTIGDHGFVSFGSASLTLNSER